MQRMSSLCSGISLHSKPNTWIIVLQLLLISIYGWCPTMSFSASSSSSTDRTASRTTTTSPPPVLAAEATPASASQQKNVSDMIAPDPPTNVQPIYNDNDESTTLLKTPTYMNYVSPATIKAVIRRDTQGFDSEPEGIIWQTEMVWVENGRLGKQQQEQQKDDSDSTDRYHLHRHGFELVTDPVPTNIDFLSQDDVIDRYYPLCQQLLEQHLSSDPNDNGLLSKKKNVQVWAFDHNVRVQQQQLEEHKKVDGDDDETTSKTTTTTTTVVQKPIGLVHGDYTTISGPRRLQLLGEPPKINDVWRKRLITSDTDSDDDDEAPLSARPLLDPSVVQECLSGQRRYSLINVWRSIDQHHPVLSHPLACIDATTVDPNHDLRILELHYQDRIGENFLVCPPSQQPPPDSSGTSTSNDDHHHHHWVYFPHMVYDECLLIKQWDSMGDFAQSGSQRDTTTSTMAIHSAFQDPTTPTIDAPARQSIEVRCVAIWDPE